MKNGPYILIVAPKKYPGKLYRNRYCYEHSYVWWKNTKKLINKNELIHHKNGIKTDNRFCNLISQTIREHNINHKLKLPKMIFITCAYCKKTVEKRDRNISSRIKHGQTDFYCNRICMAKHFGRGRKK